MRNWDKTCKTVHTAQQTPLTERKNPDWRNRRYCDDFHSNGYVGWISTKCVSQYYCSNKLKDSVLCQQLATSWLVLSVLEHAFPFGMHVNRTGLHIRFEADLVLNKSLSVSSQTGLLSSGYSHAWLKSLIIVMKSKFRLLQNRLALKGVTASLHLPIYLFVKYSLSKIFAHFTKRRKPFSVWSQKVLALSAPYIFPSPQNKAYVYHFGVSCLSIWIYVILFFNVINAGRRRN